MTYRTKEYTIVFLLSLVIFLGITYAQYNYTYFVDKNGNLSAGCQVEEKRDFVLMDRRVTFDNETLIINSSLLSKYNLSPEDIFIRDSLIKRIMGASSSVVPNGSFVLHINITMADRWDKTVVYNKTIC